MVRLSVPHYTSVSWKQLLRVAKESPWLLKLKGLAERLVHRQGDHLQTCLSRLAWALGRGMRLASGYNARVGRKGLEAVSPSARTAFPS